MVKRIYKGYSKQSKKHCKGVSKKMKKCMVATIKEVENADAELKYFKFNNATPPTFVVSATPYTHNFTADVIMPAAGVAGSDQTRIGDSITLTSLHVRMRLFSRTPATAVGARVLIVQYKQQTSLSAFNTVNMFFASSGLYDTLVHESIDFGPLYHILYDKTVNLDSGQGYDKTIAFRANLRNAKKKIQYNASTTDSINSLWLVVLTNGVNPNELEMNYQSMLRFHDS